VEKKSGELYQTEHRFVNKKEKKSYLQVINIFADQKPAQYYTASTKIILKNNGFLVDKILRVM
jgi:hypothetical protein